MVDYFIKCLLLSSIVQITKSELLPVQIRLTFINGNYSAYTYQPENFNNILKHPEFNVGLLTVIYCYGFSQTPNHLSVRDILDSYLHKRNTNFVLLNFDSILTYTLFNTNEIGSKIADGLINLFKLGVDPRAIHIVGFSLGAQIAGVIGRYVISKSKEKYTIGRITGLDPGQIMDAFVGAIEVLSDRDAEFVDVLHTESVAFGSPITTGTVSFWVNGGVLQPNCESPIELLAQTCSHLMAPTLFAFSVRFQGQPIFHSQKCDSLQDFILHDCTNYTTLGHMGIDCSRDISGNYYLQTSLSSPYSRGVAGASYHKLL